MAGQQTKRVPLHEKEYVQWDKKGRKVTGIFLGIEESDSDKGGFIRLQGKDGVTRCAASTLLRRALEPVKIGTKVEITFVSEDAPTGENKTGLKHFEVYALED